MPVTRLRWMINTVIKEFDKYMQDLGLNRLFLHAFSIRFEHPKTGETLRFNAQLDEKMKTILKKLRESKENKPIEQEKCLLLYLMTETTRFYH